MSDIATPASGSTSDTDGSDEEQVELLVQGRERRKTAGNRYQRELVQEEGADIDEEDEVALLFAGEQDEVDEEFKSEASDEDHMSSSDDDDHGPDAAADDMDGEKEIEKQAKAERVQKRKAKDALTATAALRKRPRIDPTAPRAIPKKPSKKKERVTWLPDLNNTGGRTSLRKQTIEHRATTIARLRESEAQSKISKKIREERDREKARNAPKAMTQADRLAEAERTERQNAKSLNRWEKMEQKRNEEQAAKLAALKNRKLEGPVISWRSRKGEYKEPQLPPPIPQGMEEGPKKRGRKTKAYHEQMASIRNESGHNSPATTFEPIVVSQSSYAAGSGGATGLPITVPPNVAGNSVLPPSPSTSLQAQTAPQLRPPSQVAGGPRPPVQPAQSTVSSTNGQNAGDPRMLSDRSSQPPVAHNSGSSLHGIFDYANQENEEKPNGEDKTVEPRETPQPAQPASATQPPVTTDVEMSTNADAPSPKLEEQTQETAQTLAMQAPIKPESTPEKTETPLPPPSQQLPPIPTAPPSNAAPPLPINPLIQELPQSILPAITTTPIITDLQSAPSTPVSPSPPVPPKSPIYTTKNLLSVLNFSPTDKPTHPLLFAPAATTSRKVPSSRLTKVQAHQQLCPITLLPARYRDPVTGIGYANLHAYRVLKDMEKHKFVWSGMLGCYVGREGATVARGAVEGFVAPG